jgi:regulator of replication initiation timing
MKFDASKLNREVKEMLAYCEKLKQENKELIEHNRELREELERLTHEAHRRSKKISDRRASPSLL